MTRIDVGLLVTGNDRRELLRDVSIQVDDNRITGIFPTPPGDRTAAVDARSLVAIPGFVQTHVHLCQTLFRGMADDLELLDWLRLRIFPFEAAHSAASMHASAMLGIMELIRSGTTTILDMGSVRHEEEVIRAVGETGLRAFVGKAMMDINDAYPALRESTVESLRSTRALADAWHDSYGGRVKYAVAPRFVLSCTDGLLSGAREMLGSFDGMLFHTHASESRSEVEAVRSRCKMENIEFLHHLGILSDRTCLAHCIHLSDREVSLLAETRTSVSHCPSSNLKLGSGIANIPGLRSHGINVGLGADGAPCNNSLDMFREMRLASLLQKPIHGPTAMPAGSVFEMATRGGAAALGLAREIGSIETGKKADIVLLSLENVWDPLLPGEDPASAIVFSASPENVHSVMIDGRWVYRGREFPGLDPGRIAAAARGECRSLVGRL
jgi:cytosine/adenosine deaminase-related metal-dependent hydrolase